MNPHTHPSDRRGARCQRPDLRADVPRWDELAPRALRTLEDHAADCPVCSSELSALREADAWLEARWRAAAGPDPCPPAEDLYDLAGAPGARPLDSGRVQELDDHVLRCGACRELLHTLDERPPAPLIDVPAGPAPEQQGRIFRLRPRWAAAAGLLLAAAVTLAILAQRGRESRAEGGPAWPETPLVRGQRAPGPLFPRGKLLAAPDGRPVFLPRFEIASRAGADSYRFEVRRTDGDPFSEGELVGAWEGSEPSCETPAALAEELRTGHYRWRAWAIVDGLPRDQGERNFELRLDADLAARAGALDPDASETELLDLLWTLHEDDWASDARAAAWRMPAGPERDGYLQGQAVR